MLKFSFLILFLQSLSANAQKASVNVFEAATVQAGEPVKLGWIAEITNADVDFRSRLFDLVVYPAVTKPGAVSIGSDELALSVRQKLSFADLSKVTIKTPARVRLFLRENYLSQAEFKHRITAHVEKQCQPCRVQMDQLKLPQVPKDQEILAMDLKLSDLKNNRAFVLPLHVETSRGKLPLWVTGKVSVFKETPVSKKLIRLGQVITENDFELREVDVSFVQDGVPSPKEVIERAASRLITAGEPIFFKDVKKIPDLFRGQTVKILVGTEEFEITTLGVAEEDGNLGDRIRVRSESIKKTVTGKIVEKGTVKIE